MVLLDLFTTYGPWAWFARGCRCNQHTVELLEASPLAVERLERATLPAAPSIVRPIVLGSASSSADAAQKHRVVGVFRGCPLGDFSGGAPARPAHRNYQAWGVV